MPAPNDLTPEEERMFAEHGVPSAGQGREPLDDGQQGQQQGQEGEQGQQQGQQGGDEGQQGRQTFHREDGRFASREDVEAGRARPGQGQQQGQEGEQGQQGAESEGGEGGEQDGQQRMVPHQALHEARERAAKFAQRAELAQARLNAVLEAQRNQRATPTIEMPDINADPAGYVMALEQRLAQFEQGRTETIENQRIDNAISSDEQLFAARQPDYNRASDYYVASRAAELVRFYPPEQAQEIMLKEARDIARMAWQRNQSSAETIYQLAIARGYNPSAPQHRQDEGQQGQGQQRGPTPRDVVDGIKRGQETSRSLSGGRGASAETLNANAILDMSDEEFQTWLGEGAGATRKFATIG